MSPADVHAAVEDGALLIDLRTPRPFAAAHIPGAVNLQFNRADLAERTEMMLPKDVPLVIHAEPQPIAKIAARILTDAGYDVRGQLEGGLAAWTAAGLPTAAIEPISVDELESHLPDVLVVDAREPFEYRYGHIPGAALLPYTEAWGKTATVPPGRPLAVICGDEVRSAALASLLQRDGREVRLVLGGMTDWLARGYAVEKGAAPQA